MNISTKIFGWKPFRIYTILLFLLVCATSQGQESERFSLGKVTESIFMSTDRDLYFAGEDIFFSAEYFIDNSKTTPVISNVMYVEMVHCDDNNPVVQKKYKLSDFNAQGILRIPSDVASGNYMLAAYTQYQRNFSPRHFSYRIITVLNPDSELNSVNPNQPDDSVLIVPESNILINNIKNNVVIWIPPSLFNTGNEYLVTDENLKTIKTVHPSKNGFIQTEVSCNNSEKYNLFVKTGNGNSVVVAFPEIQNTGIQTQTRISGNAVHYTIESKTENPDDAKSPWRIKIFTGNYKLKEIQNVSVVNSVTEIVFAEHLFDTGINYIVLVSPDGKIEKINSVYIPSKINSEIVIETDKNQYQPRENVKVRILAKDGTRDELLFASVSVVQEGTKKEDYHFVPSVHLKNTTVARDFLQNNVEMDDLTRKQIMVLFDKTSDVNWFDETTSKVNTASPEFVPEVRDVSIRGVFRNKKTKEPVAGHNIYVSALFNNPQLHACKTNEKGEFLFSLNNLYGLNDIFICPENLSDEKNEYEIMINNSFSEEFIEAGDIPPVIGIDNIELIREVYMNAQIEKRFGGKQEKETNQRTPSDFFNIGGNSKTTLLSDFVTLKNMEELFTEIVPGVKFKKSKGEYSFSVFDENGVLLSENPLLLLDKIPIFDPNKIMEMDVAKIEKIEVINKTYLLGANTFQGVVLITTKTDNFGGIVFPGLGTFVEFQALEQPVNVSDDFSRNQLLSSRTPDFRTTLYWKPRVKIDSGEFFFDFVTSDRKGPYEIVIKGYTSTGQPFYGRRQIEIR